MDDECIYHLRIHGQMTSSEVSAFCPPRSTIDQDGEASTRLTVRTDQAALVALIRRLHGLGFLLLSVERM
jgi:hypothetical protein